MKIKKDNPKDLLFEVPRINFSKRYRYEPTITCLVHSAIVLKLNQAFSQGVFYSFNTDNWYVHSDGQHISFSSTHQNRFALTAGQYRVFLKKIRQMTHEAKYFFKAILYLAGMVFHDIDQLQEPISVDSTFLYLDEWMNTECFSENEHTALRYGTNSVQLVRV